MSEEKLKEIKDSIDFQEKITKEHDFDMTMLQEEIDLYNEVVRLKHENKELKEENKRAYAKYINCRKTESKFEYILTEFEKWLEEELKRKNARWEQFRNQINTQELVLERLNAQIVFIDCCLKRIQELKEGKK